MNILAELFYGNIRPCDEKPSAEVRRKQNAMCEAIEKLKASMPNEQLKEKVDETFNLQAELISLSDRDAFIDGFKLGVYIAAEVFLQQTDNLFIGWCIMKKYHIYLTYHERQEIIYALLDMRKHLTMNGHYTDAIDEILEEVTKAKIKRVKVLHQ